MTERIFLCYSRRGADGIRRDHREEQPDAASAAAEIGRRKLLYQAENTRIEIERTLPQEAV